MKQVFIILLFFNFSGFGQTENPKAERLRERAYEIDKSLNDNMKFQIDSINIDFSEHRDKIKAINYFRYSRTGVEIEYYLEKDKPFLVVVRMFAPSSEYYWRENKFYIENNKIFQELEMFGQSGAVHGIAIPLEAIDDPYKYYHYNRNLNVDFFRKYIFELLDKIKNNS